MAIGRYPVIETVVMAHEGGSTANGDGSGDLFGDSGLQ